VPIKYDPNIINARGIFRCPELAVVEDFGASQAVINLTICLRKSYWVAALSRVGDDGMG
jgi:hypothetical protein